jgi:hypothetical protein
MHKFKIGQTVRFESNSSRRFSFSSAAPGSYEVRKHLPERNGEFEYHVKSSNEAHERVVSESQISRAV